MKKMASVLVTASLLFGLVGTAFATTPSEVSAAASRLQELGIVVGDPSGDMKLGDPITRAQLMKIMVWAFGKKDVASILKGAVAFPDTSTHWASGEIAIAKNIIVEQNHFEMGMPDGNFAPEGKVTAAQAVAFLMKFVGISPDSSKTWPNNYLDAAVSSGMISAAVRDSISATANTEATRGLVFFLADTAFAGYPVSAGKTVYTTYVKPSAPTLAIETADLTTTAAKATITGTVSADAKSVFFGTPANAVTVSGGNFSYDVDLTLGANDVSFTAVDLVGGTTTKSLSITRTVGTAVAIDAPASLEVVAGETANLAVKVKDAAGNVLDVAPSATSDFGTYDAGVFTAGEKAGTGTISITAGELTATVNVTVKAGELAKLVVTPATVDMSSNNTQKFVATGADKFGNEVAAGAISWASSKGVVGVDGTFGATADASGTVTVTATSGTVSGTATVNVFGVPAKVQIAAPAAIVANGKSETTVTATVLDANNMVVKNYNGNVTFNSSTTAAVSVKTATVAAVNGVATTTLTAGSSASATVLSASAQSMNGTTVTYTPDRQVASSFTLTADNSTLAAATGSQSSLTVTMVDQTGNPMLAVPSTTYKVKLTSSDKTVIAFNSNADNSGELTFSLSGGKVIATSTVYANAKVGGVNVTGAVTAPTGSSLTVNSVSLNTMVVGAPYQIKVDDMATKKAGETVTGTFRVLDFNGNQLTALAAQTNKFTVKVYGSASSTTAVSTLSNQSTLAGGKGTFTYSTNSADTFTYKVTGTADVTVGVDGGGLPIVNSYTLQEAQSSNTFTPAAANRLALTVTPDTLQANGAAQGTLKVTISDRYGNAVTDGSYAVTIEKTTDNGTTADFTKTVLNTVNGEATVSITSTTLENATGDVFTATATGLNGATVAVKTAIFGAPYQVDFVTSATNGAAQTSFSGKASGTAKIYVGVKDAYTGTARLVTSDNNRLVTVEVYDGTTLQGSYTATTVNGIATVVVTNPTTAKNYKIVATADGLQKDELPSGLSVTNSGVTALVVTADRADLAADGSYAKLTVKMVDANGNAVNATATTDVYVKITSSTLFGSIAGTAGSGDWSTWKKLQITSGSSVTTIDGTSSYQANNSGIPGTDVITARFGDTTAGVTDGTISISTHTVGSLTQLSVDSVSNATATATIGSGKYHTVKVRLLDPNGTLLTKNTDNVSIAIDDATGTLKVYAAADGTGEIPASGGKYTTAAVKGIATFYVIDTKADTVTYGATTSGITTPVEVSGTFTAAAIASIQGSGTPFRLAGNGQDVATYTAKIVDGAGNTVTTASGTVNFEAKLGSGDYITVQQSSASVVNGEAVITIQAKSIPAGIEDTQVSIVARYDIDQDGTIESGEFVNLNNILVIDSKNPIASSLGIVEANGANFVAAHGFTASVVAKDGVALSESYENVGSVVFQYKAAVNGVWTDLGTATYDAGDSRFEFAATGIDDGSYLLRAVVTDKVGHVLTTASGSEYAFTVDAAAPTAVVAKTAGNTFTVTFTDANAIVGADVATNFSFIDANTSGDSIQSVAYDAATKTATVTMNGVLESGDTIGVKATVLDQAGNAITATTIVLP